MAGFLWLLTTSRGGSYTEPMEQDGSVSSGQTVVAPAATSPAVGGLVRANFGRRLAAALLDGVIMTVINFVIALPFGIMAGVAGASEEGAVAGSAIMLIPQVLGWVINLVYMVYFIGSRGQTPGKMVLKIKVVSASGGQVPGYGVAVLREVVGKFLSGVVLGLGYFWMLWDKDKQTWHDKIAKTVVVRV